MSFLPVGQPDAYRRVLSLGAGVQSTTIALASAAGLLPKLDAAIFADTGWEPRSVYEHLDRLDREVLQPAGIPLLRVSSGNLRDDTLKPDRRFVAVPFYLLNTDGQPGMGRRQCTSEYKLKPIKEAVRGLLGAELKPNQSGRVRYDRVPSKRWVEQWIGISTDEVGRAKDSDVSYARNAFPLLDLGWSRQDCLRYLERAGWGSTPKSACIGCPFHGNRVWRQMRDNDPESWEDAVAFDAALRTDQVRTHLKLDAAPYLHRSRVPLGQAPIDRLQRDETATMDLLDVLRDQEWDEAEDPPGCSPFACDRGPGPE